MARMKLAAVLTLFAMTMQAANSVHEFTLNSIDGKAAPLTAYKGKVLLMVNVASQCGYTPQYTGLESLYRKYKDKGLVVVGFPANNFGGQEPGSDTEIKQFCSRKYDVTFPMYSKISVKGADAAPLYQFLQEKGGAVKWNFTKFLVDGNGNVVKKFDSGVAPESPELVSEIERLLKK
ncbi:MAG: glutathione peroxidase [Bryobacterales bacterium]|nr:glutathione peroxidase [Bryobacterales bacterium]